MTIIMYEMKNILARINSRLDIAGGRKIRESKNIAIEKERKDNKKLNRAAMRYKTCNYSPGS